MAYHDFHLLREPAQVKILQPSVNTVTQLPVNLDLQLSENTPNKLSQNGRQSCTSIMLVKCQFNGKRAKLVGSQRAANPSMSLQHIPLIGVQHLTSTVIVQQPLLMPTWLRNLNLVIDHSKVNKATVKVSSRGGNVKSLYFQ